MSPWGPIYANSVGRPGVRPWAPWVLGLQVWGSTGSDASSVVVGQPVGVGQPGGLWPARVVGGDHGRWGGNDGFYGWPPGLGGFRSMGSIRGWFGVCFRLGMWLNEPEGDCLKGSQTGWVSFGVIPILIPCLSHQANRWGVSVPWPWVL